jgi:hypothetical protein
MLLSPMMRDWARHLLEYEAVSDVISGQTGPPTLLVFEKLRQQLTAPVGAAGFQAIAYRALALAKAEVPGLSAVQITAEGRLRGFNELDPQMEQNTDGEVGIALISQLLGLFLAFLGPATTQRLVQDVFPILEATTESNATTPLGVIFQEANNLRSVSESLESLASEHPNVEDGLASISRNIRNTATLLEVFAAVRNASDALRDSHPTLQPNGYLM